MALNLTVRKDHVKHAQDFFREHLKLKDQQTGLPHAKWSSANVADCEERQSQAISVDLQGFGSLDVVFIGSPYPPCRCSLRNLKSMTLTQLIMNHHHRGQFLLAKLVDVVEVCGTTTTADIEDIHGNSGKLAIGSACMYIIDGQTWSEVGHWFVIKEPFLTLEEYNQQPCIRIDHPSDLVNLEDVPADLRNCEPFAGALSDVCKRTPLECKEAGNSALAHNNVGSSHAYYTQGLLLTTSDTHGSNRVLEQDLHRNRSLVRLTLGYYEGAIADAIAAMTHVSDDEHKKLDAKAYFRAASASYKLKQFDRSNQFLQALLSLIPTDKQALTLLKRNKRRLREQERGEYDISGILRRVTTNPLVDAAEYHRNTAAGSSKPGHGRGLFATQDLKPGDLIMTETAFCYLSGHEDSVAFECKSRNPDDFRIGRIGLWNSVTKKLMSNPVLGDEFLQLHCTQEGYGIHVDMIDGLPVVDTFQIHDMVTANIFAVPADKKDHFSGIWIRSAYINHSCIPNAERDVVGDMLMVRAIRSIRKGEEITMCYIGFDRDDTRMQNFEWNWGFQCDCLQCLTDAKCPKASLAERARLSKDFQSQHKSKDPEEILEKNLFDTLEQYVKKIAATYDSELYSNLPKPALIPIQILLLRAYITVDDFVKASRTAAELLRSLGFEVDSQGDGILAIRETANSFIPRDAVGLRGIVANHAVHALDAGLRDAAQELLRFAKTLELILCGTSKETLEFWNEAIKPQNALARMMRNISHVEQSK